MKGNSWFGLFAMLAIALAFAQYVSAVNLPASPNVLIPLDSHTFNASNYPVKTLQAEAGNITEVSINARTQTRSWQGYFGNISGTITLEDALGFVFYDWADAEPKGQVYATINDSPDWTGIHCFNYTAVNAEINLTEQESYFGIPDLAVDGINETFNETTHDLFYVGPRTIDANTCHSTYIYQNGTRQISNFQNVLLTDNTSMIFTTLVENRGVNDDVDKLGYNPGYTPDFQMLVAEDGHTNDSGAITTTYYFFVELT